MKSFKALSILAICIISAFVLTSSSCGGECLAPSIVFDPSATSMTAAPGEALTFKIVVTGEADNIKSITVSKTSNGVTNSSFISEPSVGEKGKTITLTDSIDKTISYGAVITYTVTAISDCKDATAETKTMTVTIGPSSKPLDPFLFEVANTTAPRVYSRFSSAAGNPSAWDLMGRLPKFAADLNSEKDIRDSLVAASPFNSTTVRWGSRNGTKFVKAPTTFDYANASAKSIVDAYKAGTPSDLINFAANDYIIVNIKNNNTYAVVMIRSITDDGAASNEDYTFFKYKLAQ